MAKRIRNPEKSGDSAPLTITGIDGFNSDAGDAGSVAATDSDIAGATDPGEASAVEFIGDGSGDGGPKRRRGRPLGSGAGGGKQKAKTIPLNIKGVEKLLIGIHAGISVITSRREWALDTSSKDFDGKTEAEFLATSINDVSRHYGGEMFDQKTVDWLSLIQCVALIYGARIITIRRTPKAPPKAKPATVQQTAQHHAAPMHFNGGHEPNAGRVHIEGLGDIDLPDDNPLSPNYKPTVN